MRDHVARIDSRRRAPRNHPLPIDDLSDKGHPTTLLNQRHIDKDRVPVVEAREKLHGGMGKSSAIGAG